MSESNSLIIHKLNTFDELIVQLHAFPLKKVIFRGVSDSSFELIPSILRGDQATKKSSNKLAAMHRIYDNFIFSHHRNPRGGYSHIEMELSLLYHFYRAANYQGLRLPKIDLFNHFSGTILGTLQAMQYIQRTTACWYGDKFEDIAALAQHYGMPTRMLDFSYEKNTAIYMAVIDTRTPQRFIFKSGL